MRDGSVAPGPSSSPLPSLAAASRAATRAAASAAASFFFASFFFFSSTAAAPAILPTVTIARHEARPFEAAAAWWLKVENPHFWGGLRRAPEAMASFPSGSGCALGRVGAA